MAREYFRTVQNGEERAREVSLPFSKIWSKITKLGNAAKRVAINIRATEECLRDEIELAKHAERRHYTNSSTAILKVSGRLKKLQELAATGCRNTQWSLLNPGTFVIPQNEWYIVPFNTEVLHGYGAELGWKYKPEIVGSSHLSAFLYLEVSGAVDSYKIHLAVFKNGEYHLPLSVRCAWKPTDGNAFYELSGVARVFHECTDEIDIRVRYDVSLGDSIQKPGNLYKVVGHVEAGYDHCCGSQPIESHGDYITTISLP